MPGSWFYDLIYRFGAPWEIGVRTELRQLVEGGRLTPEPGDRAIDLGCGTGANTVYLAQQGWHTVGVDFSRTALDKAARKASKVDGALEIDFVRGDLTATAITGVQGPFQLLLDYGTLDDLKGDDRGRMANLITSLAAPGARFLLWCFFGPADELPRISFKGPSRLSPAIEPGEVERRFGQHWDIEHLPEPAPATRTAAFLLTRNEA